MAENLRSATQLVEQGHVRVGTDVVKDPAFMVYKNNYLHRLRTHKPYGNGKSWRDCGSWNVHFTNLRL